MPLRTTLALLLLIAAPLALLGWVGMIAVRDQRVAAERQVRALAESRLRELASSIDSHMSDLQREIQSKLIDAKELPQDLIELERTNPFVRASFWVSPRGQLLYPGEPIESDSAKQALHNDLLQLSRQRPVGVGNNRIDVDLVELAPVETPVPSKNAKVPSKIQQQISPPVQQASPPTQRAEQSTQRASSFGQLPSPTQQVSQVFALPSMQNYIWVGDRQAWQEWYIEQGLQLVCWDIKGTGFATGVLLERSRWLSEIINMLPDGESGLEDWQRGCTLLKDANGTILYQWGVEASTTKASLASVPLATPLASWRLEYLTTQAIGQPAWTDSLPLIASLVSVGLLLLVIGGYVLSSTARQLRLARQHVSFAGQVSHELRTPLTNIRLYTEMAKLDLERGAAENGARVAERLSVIDAESKRLSRLISGVLEFVQGRSKSRPPRWQSVVPDEIIRQVLVQFAPSFANNQIEVTCELNAGQSVLIDPDILEQILVNLINNVEKYAADGKSLRVASRIEGHTLLVTVADQGPGIATRNRRKVFKPYVRLDDSITAPSGTGLGLTIALAAARRHGGEIRVLDVPKGACFEVRLAIQDPAMEA
jgi:signal transduction histidine kinase